MALNIADLFEHAADAVPDRIAVVCGDRQVTFRELDQRTNQLAHHLAGLGVGPGDHVGMYARNSIEALETLLATYKLRARTVNINYRYVENELRYMFTDADLVALVYDKEFAPLVSIVLPDSHAGARFRRDPVARAGRTLPATTRFPASPTTKRSPPRHRNGTSARAATMTSTCCTPAARPVTRRACCGGRKTSGERWAAASTS